MTNVTLAFDNDTLLKGRARAQQKGSSFNAYLRQLVEADIRSDTDQLHETFAFMDKHPLQTTGVKWTRGELHERL